MTAVQRVRGKPYSRRLGEMSVRGRLAAKSEDGVAKAGRAQTCTLIGPLSAVTARNLLNPLLLTSPTSSLSHSSSRGTGASSVGKSSLLLRFTDETFLSPDETSGAFSCSLFLRFLSELTPLAPHSYDRC